MKIINFIQNSKGVPRLAIIRNINFNHKLILITKFNKKDYVNNKNYKYVNFILN